VNHRAVKAGGLLTCKAPKPGGLTRPWISKRRWFPEARPQVGGSVRWPQAGFSLAVEGERFAARSDGIPRGTPSGSFPLPAGDPAAPYVGAGPIVPHAVSGSLPLPRAGTPKRTGCVSPKAIGIALNGVPLLAPVDRRGRDLAARAPVDRCGGTLTDEGIYGYLAGAPCLDTGASGEHSPPVGYTRAGIYLFGSRGAGGRVVRSTKLDACHGHTHRITVNGVTSRAYHYHQTAEFPYTVGCFRRKPAPLSLAPRSPSGSLKVAADPGLFPAFDPAVSDYVVRCTGAPVAVGVETRPGMSASIDGGGFATGSSSASVPLAAGQAFTISTIEGGDQRTYHVRCLPADFPPFTYERNGRPSAAHQIVTPTTFGGSNYVAVFDRNGAPVWWYEPQAFPLDAKLLSDGTLAWGRYFGGGFTTNLNGAYEVRRLDGSLVREVKTVGSPADAHDLLDLPNGNFLALTYKPRAATVDLSPFGGPAAATVVDAEIQELNPAGNVVWSWNSKDHITLAETGRWWPTVIANPTPLPDGRTAYDPVHINSIEVDGGSIVISTRNTDSIYSIDRATGAIEWKLGGTPTPDSLTVLGDPLGAFPLGAQHDARVLADGTVTIHDNRSDLGQPPRGVRYAIDEGAGTATYVESIADPQIAASACCGSARRQPGGSWVFSWGGQPSITELEPDGDRIFKLSFTVPPTFSYRSFPVPDGGLSPAALRAGMSAMFPR
jgi:hypothetical protein